MKLQVQRLRVEKQQVRTEGQIERLVGKWKVRQFGIDVSLTGRRCFVVGQECGHRLHPNSSQRRNIGNRIPDELVLIFASLLQDLFVGFGNALPNHAGTASVDGIDREYVRAARGRFGIKCSRAIAAAQNGSAQVRIGDRKHANVLIVRTAPRYDTFKLKHGANRR
jgi:hypothetical protein